MQAYEESFQNNDTTMVLSPDSDFFRYFGDPSGRLVNESGSQAVQAGSSSNDPKCKDESYDLTGVDFLGDGGAGAVSE